MDFIMYLIVSVAAYLGLAGGIALTHIAPEELKPGKRYFDFLKEILFAAILLTSVYTMEPAVVLGALIVLGVFIRFARGKASIKIGYPLVGAVLGLYSSYDLIIPVVAGLIFMYGIVAGTRCVMYLESDKIKKQLVYVLGSNFSFFITALPLYFLNLKIIA